LNVLAIKFVASAMYVSSERGEPLLFRANDAVEPDVGIISRPLVPLHGDARSQAIAFRVIPRDASDASGMTL